MRSGPVLFNGLRRHFGAMLVMVFCLLLMAAPAAADTAVYYSAPERVYGWCAGFAYNRSHSCARGYCIDAGGSNCQAVVECGGGWGAIALPRDPGTGIGAVCGLANAHAARSWAISHCSAASNSLCWTDVTFNGRGKRARADADRAFDRTWYAQAMLQIRHYEPGGADGRLGPGTRRALAKFQADLGLPADGQLSDETFERLLDAVGGPQQLIGIIDRDVVRTHDSGRFSYQHSAAPRPKRDISDALAALPEDRRRIRIAAILSASGRFCRIPALEVERALDESDIWFVTCADNAYTLILSADGTRTIMSR